MAATTTLNAAGRLVLVVVARDLATGTLTRIAAQTHKLQASVEALSKTMMNLGIVWAGSFVMGGTFFYGITKSFSELETATTFAVKRSTDLTEVWRTDFPTAVNVAMKKIQSVAAETGLAGTEIAHSLEAFIASGFRASTLLGDIADTSAESASNLMYVAKAAQALGYSAEDIATVASQIMNIYESAEEFRGGITTSFRDTSIALQNFSKDNMGVLRGLLDELNYVTNTMKVDLDDIRQAFQYAGGTIVTSGTSVEDMLAIISRLVLTGIAPGRIGRFLRSTVTDLDQLSVSTEKWAKSLMKAFGLQDESRELKSEIKTLQKHLKEEADGYLKKQEEILKKLEARKTLMEFVLNDEELLNKLIKNEKLSLEEVNKLRAAGLSADDIQELIGNEQARLVLQKKYLELGKKIKRQEEYVNQLREKGAIANEIVFKDTLDFVSLLMQKYAGIDWKPPQELIDKLSETDNLIAKWETFKEILDTIPWDKLGSKAGAVRRVLMQAFFGERWADLGQILLSSLDPIKEKSKEIAKKSRGSVEKEFEQWENTLEAQWSKFIERIKKRLEGIFPKVKPEILNLFDKVSSMFTPETVRGITNFIMGFVSGLKEALSTLQSIVNLLNSLGFSGAGAFGIGKLVGLGLLGGPAMMMGGSLLGFFNNIFRLMGRIKELTTRTITTVTPGIGPTEPIFQPEGFKWVPYKRRYRGMTGRWVGPTVIGKSSPIATEVQTNVLQQVWEFFYNPVSMVLMKIQGLFARVFGGIASRLGTLFAPITAMLTSLGSRIIGALGPVGSVISMIFGGLSSAVGSAMGAITGFLGSLMAIGATVGVIATVVSTLAGFFYGLGEAILAAMGGMSGLSSIASTLGSALSTVATAVLPVLNLFFALGRFLGSTLVLGFRVLISVLGELAIRLTTFLQQLGPVWDFIQNIIQGVSWLIGKIGEVVNVASNKLNEQADKNIEILQNWSSTSTQFVNNVEKAVEDSIQDVSRLGDNLSSLKEPSPGIASGIQSIGVAADSAAVSVGRLAQALSSLQKFKDLPSWYSSTGLTYEQFVEEREMGINQTVNVNVTVDTWGLDSGYEDMAYEISRRVSSRLVR